MSTVTAGQLHIVWLATLPVLCMFSSRISRLNFHILDSANASVKKCATIEPRTVSGPNESWTVVGSRGQSNAQRQAMHDLKWVFFRGSKVEFQPLVSVGLPGLFRWINGGNTTETASG